MNFFKFYIGDYQRDTAHLSITEHGAYVLMLQHYYATEKPLPTGKALHRMLRAQDKAERDAIDTIAAQFWQATDAGLVNERADAEITKANAQAETNRTIAQQREAKRKAAREGNEWGTNRVTNGQPNHSQTPDTNTENTGRAATSTVVARASEPETEGHTPTPAGLICRAMKSQGLAAVNPGDPRLLALIAQGATVAEFEGLTAEAVEKRKGFAWVLAVLAARRADAAELRLAPSAEEATPWHEGGRKAIEGKAATLGIGPWDEVQEQWHQYRARVFKAAGFTPERSAA